MLDNNGNRLTGDGNEITEPIYPDSFTFEAWTKQNDRLINVKGKRVWVPEYMALFYDTNRHSNLELAQTVVLIYKQAWSFLNTLGKLRKLNPSWSLGTEGTEITFGKILGKTVDIEVIAWPVEFKNNKFGAINLRFDWHHKRYKRPAA